MPEGGGGEEPGGLSVVIHVGNGRDGVVHLVVHDGVHVDRDRVLGQNLKAINEKRNSKVKVTCFFSGSAYFLRWHVKGQGPHVDLLVRIDAGNNEEDPGAPGASAQKSAEPEDDHPLVLLDHLSTDQRRSSLDFKYNYNDIIF